MTSANVPDVAKEKPQHQFDPEVFRDLSTQTILFHHTIAERLGLGPTDHKCLDFIIRASADDPMTPGKLAELTTLTTGAITGVLDRLEAQGFVRREKDPDDRRQVIVRLLPQRLADLGAIFGPFLERVQAIGKEFTPHELERIEHFARLNISLLQSEIVRLRSEMKERVTEDVITASLGAIREGRFEIPRGASNIVIGSCDGDDLYRARFEGAIPVMKHERGHVSLIYKMSITEMLRFRRSSGHVDLNRAIPWRVRMRGGAAAIEADFRTIRMLDFDLAGGVSGVTILLGPPDENIPIRIRGGANGLRIVRPANVPARLIAKGGVSGLAIDAMRLGSVGGIAEWASPDFTTAHGRYDIEVLGGANKLALEVG